MKALFDYLGNQTSYLKNEFGRLADNPVNGDDLYGEMRYHKGFIQNGVRERVEYGLKGGALKDFGPEAMKGEFRKDIIKGGLGVGLFAAAGAGLWMNYLGFSGGAMAAVAAAPLVVGLAGLGVFGASQGLEYLAVKGIVKKGIPGALNNLIGGSAFAANSIVHAGMAVEGLARSVFTGGIWGSKLDMARSPTEKFVDAWLPNFRNMPMNDVRKFAPNPSIVKRLIGFRAAGAIFAGASEALNPRVADPTVFYDGVNMRRKSDMGVHAGYGQNLMSSSMNLDQGTLVRMASHIF